MSIRSNTPPDPASSVSIAKSYLMCTEEILLDIKSVNLNAQTAELELLVAIKSIETYLNKAKVLLKT